MDFELTEAQTALRDLAEQVFADHCDADTLRAIDRAALDGAGDGIDRDLWRAFAGVGVLQEVADPDSELAAGDVGIVCEVLGRHLAPIPLWQTLAALLTGRRSGVAEWAPIAAAVASGEEFATVALNELGTTRPGYGTVRSDTDGRLTGTKLATPTAPVARWALVPVAEPTPALHVVDLTADGVSIERFITTDRKVAGHVHFDRAASLRLGDAALIDYLVAVSTVLVCAAHAGVCRGATDATATHLMTREQFGRPLSAFQGTVLRLADAQIDTEAITVTARHAAWQLDQADHSDNAADVSSAIATAKWWAAEGGHRVVHTSQHLHGGISADIDYPIHRFFVWGKQLGDTLGGASLHADELGRLVAESTMREVAR